jgi:hypothetical protein
MWKVFSANITEVFVTVIPLGHSKDETFDANGSKDLSLHSLWKQDFSFSTRHFQAFSA